MIIVKNDNILSIEVTNILKGIAICAMFWHHLFLNHAEYGMTVFQIALIGKVCVSIFLFLSGYGLSIQFQKVEKVTIKETTHFLLNRFVKFYHNYWFIFIVFVPIGVFYFDRNLQNAYGVEGGAQILYALEDFFGLLGYKSYNITWWFNKLIIMCYVLFPLLFLILKKANKVSRIIIILLLLVLTAVRGIKIDCVDELFCYFIHFTIGVLCALNNNDIKRKLNKYSNMTILIVVILLLILCVINRQIGIVPFFKNIRMDLLITILLTLFVVSARNYKIGVVLFIPFKFLGCHSANMYLTHTFLFYYFFPNFFYQFNNPLLIFMSLLISCLFLSIIIENIKELTKYNKIRTLILGMF